MFPFFKDNSIESLRGKNITLVAELRPQIKILIIDDEPFTHLDKIRQHRFNPTHITDLEAIELAKDYHIILCDIQGVGKKFESPFEGAHIIGELNKYYPTKVIIGYTGSHFHAGYNKYFSLCDDMVKKDIDSDEWVEKLDFAIRCCIDPVYQWKKIHKILVDKDVSSKKIVAIEKNFVKHFNNRGTLFPLPALANELPPDVKTILLNISSSAIFQIGSSIVASV